MSRSGGCRVYIGNLPGSAREKDLEKFFKGYGRKTDFLIKQGFGFVEFDDYRDADDAVYELNGKEILGERVSVEHARGTRRGRSRSRDRRDSRDKPWLDKYGPPTRTDYRITIENLSTRVSWQDLKDLMRKAGDVTFADAHKDRRNEGVVEFASRRDMERAIDKFDDYDLNGRRLKIYEEKKRSGGRSRSRSKSRSRSRRGRKSRSRSKSRRSRSRSKDRKDRSRSKSRRSRSRSKDRKDRSGSKSRSRSKRSKDRSKSRSAKRSKSRSRSGKRSRSRSKSRDVKKESRSRSKSLGEKKSRSRSRDEKNSRSRSHSKDAKKEKSGSRSRSKSRSRSGGDKRSPSRSQERESKKSRGDSRSKSRSPMENGDRNGDMETNGHASPKADDED